MKLYLTLLVMINIASGEVGDIGVSGTDANSYMSYESGLPGQASLSQTSLPQDNYPAQGQIIPLVKNPLTRPLR